MYRVIVVDEQPLILLGYRQLLCDRENWSICGEASDQEVALRMAASHKPHLVVVDVFGRNIGFHLIETLRRRHRKIRILVVSAMDAEFVSKRCLWSGVHGFVGKWEPASKLLEAIRAIRRGRLFFDGDSVAASLNYQLSSSRNAGGHLVNLLSDREFEVFIRVGRGLTSIDIGHELKLSTKTVEKHRSNIRKKLKLRTVSDFRRTATTCVQAANRPCARRSKRKQMEG